MRSIKKYILWTTLCAAPLAQAFEFSSPDLKNGQAVSAQYYWNQMGCSGSNESPALNWTNAPPNTRSFAITVHDKDAPTGSGFWHYVAYDLPATATHIQRGDLRLAQLPGGAKEGNTDLGKPGFFGPCPPPGRLHHYTWTIYALSVDKLPVDAQASPAMIGFNLWQHTLNKASFTVTAGPR